MKVYFDVELDNPLHVKAMSAFFNTLSSSDAKQAKIEFPTEKLEPKPAAPVKTEEPKKKVAPPKVKKQAEEPKTPEKENSYTIDQVRLELSKKVKDHKEQIKNKLTELGAPNVTKLDSEKYPEFVEYLQSL